MAKLPLLSSTEVVKMFQRWGWQIVTRRGKGSHIILVKEGHIATLSVPDHRQVARGTLRTLIARADLTVEEFLSVKKIGSTYIGNLKIMQGCRTEQPRNQIRQKTRMATFNRIPITAVQKQVGHKKLTTTQIYSNLAPEQVREAYEKVGN